MCMGLNEHNFEYFTTEEKVDDVRPKTSVNKGEIKFWCKNKFCRFFNCQHNLLSALNLKFLPGRIFN